MAGQNRVFKEGDVLFRQGDPADCMYLVRKGALSVYIAKDDGDLNLASLDSGAIVGEMAFFDNKPRSASVKACQTTEVTQITRADFDKLLTQIPKWMVTMMQSLSGRLRSTNERLQKLEESALLAAGGPILNGQKYPFHILQKTLRTMNLAQMKDGEKDGREHSAPLDSTKALWNEIVTEDPQIFDRILAKLVSLGLVTLKKNALKQDIIAYTNRGGFAQLTDFLAKYAPRFATSKPFFDEAALELFHHLVEATIQSGYEALNVNINELAAQQSKRGVNTTKWGSSVGEVVKKLDLKLSKSGQNLLVKIITKEHKPMRTCLDQMHEFLKAGLV